MRGGSNLRVVSAVGLGPGFVALAGVCGSGVRVRCMLVPCIASLSATDVIVHVSFLETKVLDDQSDVPCGQRNLKSLSPSVFAFLGCLIEINATGDT
jgi:hypothetical protein